MVARDFYLYVPKWHVINFVFIFDDQTRSIKRFTNYPQTKWASIGIGHVRHILSYQYLTHFVLLLHRSDALFFLQLFMSSRTYSHSFFLNFCCEKINWIIINKLN